MFGLSIPGVMQSSALSPESSNRHDPCATGNSLRASCHNFLHFANRVGVLERGVITGPVPHQDNVIVIVDNAGHYCPSAKVYDTDSLLRTRIRSIFTALEV